MAQHNCPNCGQYGFTWHTDEPYTKTIWGCHHCGYAAYEDESFERKCPCKENRTVCRLEDEEKTYWWCTCDKTFLIPEVEEYNGMKRYSTNHPDYLFALQDEIEKKGEILVHIRYWAAGGSTDDELYRDVESFRKQVEMLPPNTNIILMLNYSFLLEGVVDESFIGTALRFPYDKPALLLLTEEKNPAKNRAFYAPNQPVENMEELKEYLEDLKGQKVKIGLYAEWYNDLGVQEVLGYVPHPGGGIYWRGPY